MITKEQSQKSIFLYRLIQLEVQKVIFLLEKALERDEIIYCCNSPNSILDDLMSVDNEFEMLIDNLDHSNEEG
jgi:hypothetical protein